MKEFNQPVNFNERIAMLYYVERFGFDALQKQLNDDILFEETKAFVEYIFSDGSRTKEYIQECISNPDSWEMFLVKLEDE